MNTARADTDDDKQAELNQLAEAYNEKTASDRDEVVCQWVAQTGSRIKEKVCRTKAQMKYDADEANRFAKKPKQNYKSE
jgi:hypothetical protein